MSALPDPDPAVLESALALAHRLADEARELSLRWFRTRVAVHTKSDDSPVTSGFSSFGYFTL